MSLKTLSIIIMDVLECLLASPLYLAFQSLQRAFNFCYGVSICAFFNVLYRFLLGCWTLRFLGCWVFTLCSLLLNIFWHLLSRNLAEILLYFTKVCRQCSGVVYNSNQSMTTLPYCKGSTLLMSALFILWICNGSPLWLTILVSLKPAWAQDCLIYNIALVLCLVE